MAGLLHEFPHVIAWLAGHSHENAIEAHPNPGGESGFWMIRTAAEVDWPQQSRLFEVFDNDDGTLSLFGTVLEHASPATAPGPGDASAFDVDELASVGRTISYNDKQSGGTACGGGPCGEGEADDRNVELLVDDPRQADDRQALPRRSAKNRRSSSEERSASSPAATSGRWFSRGSPSTSSTLPAAPALGSSAP
jgi:hypothetical protein